MLRCALVTRDVEKNARVRIGPFEVSDEAARAGRMLEVIFSGGMVGRKRGYEEDKEYEE